MLIDSLIFLGLSLIPEMLTFEGSVHRISELLQWPVLTKDRLMEYLHSQYWFLTTALCIMLAVH